MDFNTLREAAKKELNSSDIIARRDRILLEDVKKERDEINIMGIDTITIEDKQKGPTPVIVVVASELPDNYFYGGKAFHDLFNILVEQCGGDVSELNAILSETPLTVVMKDIKTSDGNPFTQVTVV